MQIPTSLADIQLLIDSQIPEDVHLDYKRSAALAEGKPDNVKAELAKDVSAFANADGGVLIYGVVEELELPRSIDGGVPGDSWSRERLESVLASRIAPRIDGITIVSIPCDEENSLFVIGVPRSQRAPHQELFGHRYYKRVGARSVILEDYEIRDLRSRHVEHLSLLLIDVDVRESFWLDLRVRNIGTALARDLVFALEPDLPEVTARNIPNWITRGLQFLYPGGEYRMTIGTIHEPLSNSLEHPAVFSVSVSYLDTRTDLSATDTFHFDLNALMNTPIVHSEAYRIAETVKTAIEKLTSEVSRIRELLTTLDRLAGGTGLDLSHTTLHNIGHILRSESLFEKLDPVSCGTEAFQEVLGVSYGVAHAINYFFLQRRQYNHPISQLEAIAGVTPDVLNKLRLHFKISEE